MNYNKIDTIYVREEGSKRLIEGQFKDPLIEYLKDNIWQFTEKVDGTNIKVEWDGYRVTFGGRTEKAEIPQRLLEKLETLFGGQTNEEMFEQKFGETPAILFGEGYGAGIQKGGLYRQDVDFILFDVVIAGNYQPRETIEDIGNYFGIDIVPIILEGTIQDGVDYVRTHRESTIAKNGALLEGLVGKTKIETFSRTGKRNIIKLKYVDLKK